MQTWMRQLALMLGVLATLSLAAAPAVVADQAKNDKIKDKIIAKQK